MKTILSIISVLFAMMLQAAAPSADKTQLVQTILEEDADKQVEQVRNFSESTDPAIPELLAGWRGGSIYIHEEEDKKVPFLLETQLDEEGKAFAVSLVNGEKLKDAAGALLKFEPNEVTPADTTSKLRKAIKTVLDLFALNNPDPKKRQEAVIKLGQEQNAEYLPPFEKRLESETDSAVKKSLAEAIAITQLASESEETRTIAAKKLGELRSIGGLTFLETYIKNAAGDLTKTASPSVVAVKASVAQIQNYITIGNFFGTAFRGLSLASVLLVAALGLAIIFGLMGVINMAHGELMMIGAYCAYVTQNYFKAWYGASSAGFELYFVAALLVSFVVTATAGLLLERSIIRFLYKRPLESLLATWGVSLVLQQVFRSIFGAANVQVSSPQWLSGSFVIKDVLLAYNRIFVIGFAIFVVWLTYLLLTKTSLGLQIRAVMQHRTMASALGVRTDRVNMMTFAFGAGLAGVAGACLSQIGNVGPSLGQNYIVDCFMIVVLGGVGNLVGTVSASLGVGVTDQILQPWLGAVLGKITVLAAIILFLQWRPAGLFVTRSRSLEG